MDDATLWLKSAWLDMNKLGLIGLLPRRSWDRNPDAGGWLRQLTAQVLPPGLMLPMRWRVEIRPGYQLPRPIGDMSALLTSRGWPSALDLQLGMSAFEPGH